MIKRILSILILSLVAQVAAASPLKEAMLRDIDFYYQTFQVRYAPADWKNKFDGWTLLSAVEDAKAKVSALQNPTLRDYHNILKDVFNSTRDYHVGVQFYSTERASLPFQVMGVGDKYFVVWIDRSKLPASSFPVQIGDEVVRFGGEKTHDVVMKLKSIVGHNVEETDKAIGELYLTRRARAATHVVPQGPIEITFQDKGGNARSLQLIWDYTAEQIPSLDQSGDRFSLFGHSMHAKPEAFASITSKTMEPGFWPLMKQMNQDMAANPFTIGGRKSFIPALGPKIWESAETDKFYAYIYQTPDRRLYGYIRIAAYDGSAEATQEFVSVMQRMEQVTDGLVIDQIHNPGGSVFYLYSLVAALTTEPMRTPKHRMTILQEDVAEALPDIASLEKVKNDDDAKKAFGGDNVAGYPADYQVSQFFLNYLRFKVDQWKLGKRLSDPYFLGIDQIMPHPQGSYSKPIMIVVDQLDFSGGDFFPAIMQDNKRATIFGTRTAGAGGYVLSVSHPNILGVSGFSVTGSIAERVDNNPIENLGVTPDIQYTLTEDDVRGGFRNYAAEIQKAMSAMVEKK